MGPLIGRLSPAPGEGNSEFIAICADEGGLTAEDDVGGWTVTVGEGKGKDDWLAIPRSNGTLPHAARDGCLYVAEKGETFLSGMGFLPAL
jgi:hypothetical protein